MSSDHDTGLLTIEKFTGENFHLWKFKMQAMLRAKSLWSAIERTLPLDTTDQDACRKEEKAMAALVLALEDEQLMHLEAIGAKVDNEDIITTLLYSLPESFESLIVSLEFGADDLTLEFLTARLLHEETRRSEGQDGGGKDGRAFYGRSRISNATMRKAGGPCFYCGKEGHFKKECRKRLAAELQSSEANLAFGHEAFAFSATSSRRGHWIINSRVTAHDQQQSLVEQLATSQQC
ncbi:hypothetical protein PhCBS80983_g06259 [Powellomyces hirtus]|uniref:CCHC-type domain-containing protein n=1 Tax=Powellomyces hirtus TaxID=109895 RepID=A0A507DRI9_9FUNG|nr:hypothetical protein PhCBS80983_g06259 [Powellomyces hirtus]